MPARYLAVAALSPRWDTDTMGSVQSINAVTLATHDMPASVAFYTVLGFHVTFGGPDSAFTTMSTDGCHVNLTSDGHACPWGRVIFHVDNVDELYAQAVDGGLMPDAPPADAPWGERYFPIHDPSGHDLSFARPL